MDDVENDEDLQDLEARLYAQVHHESGQEEFAALEKFEQPSRLVTSTSVINKTTGNVPRGRYWATPMASQHKKFSIEKSAGDDPKPKFEATASTSASAEPQFLVVDLKRNTSSPARTGVILEASGGDPEIKRSPNPLNVKNVAKKKVPAEGQEPAGPEKDSGNRSSNWMNRKVNKLNRNKKMQQKKAKAKQAREKQKSAAVELIVLDSSEEDEDVIMIPVPPPPILTIDSSDDEENPVVDDSFAKPNDVKKDESKPGGSSSRCNSPSSVMSDDFIGQQDKSRLLTEVSAADDEDLQCIGVTGVDASPPENAGKVDGSEKSTDFATPKKRVSKSSKKKHSTYEVTQSNFRAVDVYESESSDMPESVYGKGGDRNVNSVANKASSSEVEEIEIVSKTKKILRKRKASGSCRGSEPNDDSTDSENLEVNDKALPFISRGEAVENYKQKPKKRLHSRLDVNSSDNEFINKLADIVHGDNANDVDESHESNHSGDETITARHIAEDVLNQGQESVVDVEREKAIPNTTVTELDNVLNFIDNLDTSYYAIKDQCRPRAIVPEIIEEVQRIDSPDFDVEITGDNLEEAAAPAEPETGDPEVNTVYSNRDHVAWTEEMVRFYESSWGEENFNIDQILRTMDRTANWRIRNIDRFPRARKFSNVKCNNCSEFGHMRARCPQPKKDLICSMCGDIGHREPRCPNTVCLRCGRKWNIFTRTCSVCVSNNRLICPICKIRGHGIDSCPDKWRRYHSTTTINVHPNQKVFYNERKACCICGGLGHLPERCKSSNKLTEYHTPLSEIRSHAKSYDDITVKKPLPAGVVGVNLMCEPNDKILFPFTTKVNKSQCYGRFISAVGLLYNRKRPSIGQTVQVKKKKSKKNYVLNPFATNFNLSDEIHDADNANDVVSEVFVNNENKLNTSESMAVDKEATFKSPNDLPESNTKPDSNVEKKTEGVKLILKKDKTIDEAAVDSDSNYSFSEHFSHNETAESSPPKTSKGREVGPLPDFIPLDDSDDDEIDDNEVVLNGSKGPISAIKLNIDYKEDEEEVEEICEGKIYLNEFQTKFLLSSIGSKFLDENSKIHGVEASIDTNALRSVLIIKGYPSNQENFHTELMDRIKKLSNQDEEICEAKIYLNKFHSKFLLSPNGSKFLIETSKNHNVKASIEWTAVGNVLIIEGLPSDQDSFHSELMQAIKKLSNELNRRELEQSTKVPRKREALIRFLQENFLLLENDIGNPNDFYRRVRINEKEINKSRFKAGERSRRQLNIILMGQAGLRDGHMHLYALQKNLETLVNDESIQDVSNELRDEIDGHWKYIFSSYPHENYDKLIRQYFELKKSNKLPKIHLDSRLIGKKQLDTTFTKEQNIQLMKPNIPIQNENPTAKSKMVINPMSLSQSDMMPIALNPPQSQEDHQLKNPQEEKDSNDQTAGLQMFQNQLQQQENQRHQSQNRHERSNRQQNQQQRNRQQFLNRQRQQHQGRQQQHQNRQQQQQQNRQQQYQNREQQHQNSQQQQNRQQNRQQQQQQNRQQVSQQSTNQQQSRPGGSGGQPFVPEKIREINKKWEDQAEVLMNQMTQSVPPKVPKNTASPHWSRECMKYIVCCMNKCGSNPIVAEKLHLLEQRASRDLLSLNDFKALQRIYFSVLKNVREV